MDVKTSLVVHNLPKMTYADLTGFAEGIQLALRNRTCDEVPPIDNICEALLDVCRSWQDAEEEQEAE